MNFTAAQIKFAKEICKQNGINPKVVTKSVGYGFWIDRCGGTFEGYIRYIATPYVGTGVIDRILMQNAIDTANRNFGAEKLR